MPVLFSAAVVVVKLKVNLDVPYYIVKLPFLLAQF